MAITGISAIGNKQIIAAGAQSTVKAAQDSNGNSITATYQSTAGMSNYQTTADMSNYATTGQVADKLDISAFTTASALLNDDIQTVSAAIPVLSSLNTEGITDIQLVNELPVNPVSSILYLIPGA